MDLAGLMVEGFTLALVLTVMCWGLVLPYRLVANMLGLRTNRL